MTAVCCGVLFVRVCVCVFLYFLLMALLSVKSKGLSTVFSFTRFLLDFKVILFKHWPRGGGIMATDCL